MKRCAQCKEHKDRTEFHKSNQHKDGLKPYCKACRKARAQDYYQRNKTAIQSRNKRRRKDPKKRKADQARANERRRERGTEYLEKQREYRSANWERHLARQRAYRAENRDEFNRKSRERNRRKRNTGTKSRVYFISDGEYVKIGYSRMDLAYKLQTFQGLNARELTLLGSIPGANVIERQIHKQFDHLRVRGEWFKLTDEIANYLNTLEA